MSFQNLLDLMILPHVAEPAIQLNKQDAVNLPCLHVGQKLLYNRTLQSRLAGAMTFVTVNIHDFIAVIIGVLREDLLLRLQAVAV